MSTTTPATYRVGLLGFGNVNQAFVQHYRSVAESVACHYGFSLQFAAVCDSRCCVDAAGMDISELLKMKKSGTMTGAAARSLEDMTDVIQHQYIDILIDGLPSSKNDEGPSFSVLTTALTSGVHVICANKSPLVFKGAELLELARANKVSIGVSGATAGCLPTAGVMMHELAGSGIECIRGVLNGTSNYILDSMRDDGLTMEQAIKKAIDLGIAEPDYQDDLSGKDTAYKLIILALLLTGTHIDPGSVSFQGVSDIDGNELRTCTAQGEALRLVGICEIRDGKPHISVAPEKLSSGDPLYAVRGTGKGITFKTRFMGELTVIGGSSGRTHVAAALLKDIINAHKT